jgi:hypothetical protein
MQGGVCMNYVNADISDAGVIRLTLSVLYNCALPN